MRSRPDPSGYVYVMHVAGDGPFHVKIGHSKDPLRRLRQLSSLFSSINAPRLVCAEFAEDRFQAEKEVHRALKDFRHEGKELFVCSVETAIRTVKAAAKHV